MDIIKNPYELLLLSIRLDSMRENNKEQIQKKSKELSDILEKNNPDNEFNPDFPYVSIWNSMLYGEDKYYEIFEKIPEENHQKLSEKFKELIRYLNNAYQNKLSDKEKEKLSKTLKSLHEELSIKYEHEKITDPI